MSGYDYESTSYEDWLDHLKEKQIATNEPMANLQDSLHKSKDLAFSHSIERMIQEMVDEPTTTSIDVLKQKVEIALQKHGYPNLLHFTVSTGLDVGSLRYILIVNLQFSTNTPDYRIKYMVRSETFANKDRSDEPIPVVQDPTFGDLLDKVFGK